MPIVLTKRRMVSRPFVFLLSATLFAWGLQAKLSLYQQPSRSHPVSVAKLLPDNQVNKKTGAPGSSDRRAVSRFAFYSAIVLYQPRFTVSRGRQLGEVVAPSIPSYSYALFVRPPPSRV
jgi:hypothetical protein